MSTLNRLSRRQSVPEIGELTSASEASLKPRKHVSTACSGCQQRRIKCSGQHPCEQCMRRNIKCVLSVSLDGRRKEVRKRKAKGLESDSQLLNNLLRTFRESPDDEVAQVVALMRSNAPLHQVKLCIEQRSKNASKHRPRHSTDLQALHDHLEHIQASEAADIESDQWWPRFRDGVFDITRLTDIPPYSVPAAPWTRVTTDDALVSNLVSVWLTWHRSFYNWLDVDLFLRDMQLRNPNAVYCTPFLVNALLACACAHSDYDEARTKHGAVSAMMYAFVDEAQRLLKQEIVSPSISAAQGLIFLYVAHAEAACDANGFTYLLQAVDMCKTLEAAHEEALTSKTSHPGEKERTRSLHMTLWGIFNFLTMEFNVYQMPQQAYCPEISLPLVVEENYETLVDGHNDAIEMDRDIRDDVDILSSRVTWRPYPLDQPASWEYFGEIFHYRSKLSLIAMEASQLLYGTGHGRSTVQSADFAAAVHDVHRRMVHWHQSLPSYLQLKEDASAGTLSLSMYFLVLVMALFKPLEGSEAGAPSAVALRAQKIRREAALQTVQICKIWQASYGTGHWVLFSVQAIAAALWVLLLEPDNMTFRSEITELCICFRAISRRTPFALATFRMLSGLARNRGRGLPPEVDSFFQEFDRLDWQPTKMKRTVVSLYPAIDGQEIDGIRINTMSDFFERMEQLELEHAEHADSADGVDDDDDDGFDGTDSDF